MASLYFVCFRASENHAIVCQLSSIGAGQLSDLATMKHIAVVSGGLEGGMMALIKEPKRSEPGYQTIVMFSLDMFVPHTTRCSVDNKIGRLGHHWRWQCHG